MSKPDGGQAFPIPGIPSNWDATKQDGMSLRDYFAGQALAGIFASCSHPESSGYGIGMQPDAAKEAYHHADEMIAQRERTS